MKQKVFIKTDNSVKKININYAFSLLFIFILSNILYLLFNYHQNIIILLKNFLITTISIYLFTYIVNIIQKKSSFKLLISDINLLSLSLIISLFSLNNPPYIIIIASFITVIVKLINSKRNISASLYGILIFTIYNYFFPNHISNTELTYIDYLINKDYLSPILTIISFLYLHYKKIIKSKICISYFLTYSLAIFCYFFINKNNIDISFLISNSIIFLALYCLAENSVTPTVDKCQIIYGIINAIFSVVLFFIIPKLAIIIPMIISPLILTKYLETIAPKIKYNSKIYYAFLLGCIILLIITLVIFKTILN